MIHIDGLIEEREKAVAQVDALWAKLYSTDDQREQEKYRLKLQRLKSGQETHTLAARARLAELKNRSRDL